MSKNLMDLPLSELLQKFAAGKHKPGSGSAAALLGLIASCILPCDDQLLLQRTDTITLRSVWCITDGDDDPNRGVIPDPDGLTSKRSHVKCYLFSTELL